MLTKTMKGQCPTNQNLVKRAFLVMLAIIGLSSFAVAQTISIGGNQYAFQYTANPNYGLFFNSTDVQYEFRNGSAADVFSINANNGYLKTDLRFDTGADYLVPTNRYAFRSAANANYGLYFSNTDYEFRNGSAAAKLRIQANSGNLTTDGTISASGLISAPGGNSGQWNSAYGWGNHASAGYITSESDPQVGANSLNKIPRWNGSALVTGSITDTGSLIEMTNTTTVNSGYNSSTTSTGFRVGSPTGSFIAMDNNELQAYSSAGSDALLYLNYWGGDINFGSNTMWLDRSTARIGINTSAPTSKLDVRGATTETAPVVNAQGNYIGSVDVRAVNGVSVPNPGYGYGVYGEGGYRGVYGYGNGSTYTGTVAGVYGYASGSAGTRIGLYGYAYGGTTNWAGYFSGNTYTSGNVHVGTVSGATGYRLSVDGKIIGEEVKVQLSTYWPDYVFSDQYELMPMNELENFITENNHLPNIPSAREVQEQGGIELGEMQRRTVEKLEELTLYILELKKENDALKSRIDALEK